MQNVVLFSCMTLELHILDSLWTVFLGKMDSDKKILSYEVHGNTINKSSLYMNEDINFDSRILFNRYFNNYLNWRNRAFEVLEDQYRFKRDSILVSLDIKSYFYSVEFSFARIMSIEFQQLQPYQSCCLPTASLRLPFVFRLFQFHH